jgi:sugar lactone lactonase YvrE
MPRGSRAFRFAIILVAITLVGCAGAPRESPPARAAVFYPPPPDAPRIHHLATLTGERDVAAPDSEFARFIVGDDTTAGPLRQPYGAALYGSKLYVADSKAPGLAIFDLVQQRFSLLTGSGHGRMKRPINVTIDRDGTKYITDTGRDQILVYDRSDRFVNAFGDEGQTRPVDVAIAGERLYVVDIKNHQVQVLDKRSGKLLSRFGKPGSKPGELFQPTNIAIGPDGDVYVVDTGNFRVQRFTADGKPVRIYGEVGITPGSFARPKGVALDKAGRLYVGDAAFQNVQVFDNAGTLLLHFGEAREAFDGLSLPTALRIDYEGVELFRQRAAPDFEVEYLILAVSQFGPNKVDVFGFGKRRGVVYPPEDRPATVPSATGASAPPAR